MQSGLFIENTFMRYGHGKRGMIVLTLKPETIKIWGLNLHICIRLEEDLAYISSPKKKEGQEKHKEENKGKIESDAKDWENIRGLRKHFLIFFVINCHLGGHLIHVLKVFYLFSFKLSVFN